jgi:hypothetical protein
MNIYQISSYGFLPSQCEEFLPEEYEYLNYFLDYNAKHPINKFRKYIENYNYESKTEKINLEKYTLREIQKIYSITSLLSHIYLELSEPRLHKLPPCLSEPWFYSSALLGLPCVLTHSAIDLFNWRLKDKTKPFHLENIESINLIFTESNLRKSEEGFYTSMVAIEGECGPVIHHMDNIYQVLESNSLSNKKESIINDLKFINKKLKRQLEILSQLEQKCKPAHYYHYLSNLLRGSSDLYLEGIDKKISFEGGSAKQSSLIQAEDIFFGINCELNQKMREYMPKAHRTYLEIMERRPFLGNLLDNNSYPEIKKHFQIGINLMILLKNQHIYIMHKYINVFNNNLSEKDNVIENKLVNHTEILGNMLDSDLDTESEDEDSSNETELHHYDSQNNKYWLYVKYILSVFYIYLICLFIVISSKLLLLKIK